MLTHKPLTSGQAPLGCLCLLLGMSSIASAVESPSRHSRFDSRPCPPANKEVHLRCGVVRVPEDYRVPNGREIDLRVWVLQQDAARRSVSAQYDLEGGPGFGATDFLAFYGGDEGAVYRRSRDIVLADMRGTGASNPLRCAGIEQYERQHPLAPMYPPSLIAECAAKLTASADLTAYSTSDAARDIESVRLALGYEQLHLNAVSYGTTLALRYIETFPHRVRSAVMLGTVPFDRTPPRYHAIAAERALAMVSADCARDRGCSDAFGNLDDNLREALRRIPTTGDPTAREVFMEKLRVRMYTSSGQRDLPQRIYQAAHGDLSWLVPAETGSRSFADGLYLSVTCAETFALLDVEAAISASAGTRFGAYRLRRQAESCKGWPAAPADPRRANADSFDVPVLFIAGDMDPVSPPQWAEETARHFRDGRVVVVPSGAHVLDGLDGLDTCLDPLILKFFAGTSVMDLDASCVSQMKPPAYTPAP